MRGFSDADAISYLNRVTVPNIIMSHQEPSSRNFLDLGTTPTGRVPVREVRTGTNRTPARTVLTTQPAGYTLFAMSARSVH